MDKKVKETYTEAEKVAISHKFEIYLNMDSKMDNYTKITLSAYALIAPVFATIYAYTYFKIEYYVILTAFVAIITLLNFIIFSILRRISSLKITIDAILADLSIDSTYGVLNGVNMYDLLYEDHKTAINVVYFPYDITTFLSIVSCVVVLICIIEGKTFDEFKINVMLANIVIIVLNIIYRIHSASLMKKVSKSNKELKELTNRIKRGKKVSSN
ncbi:hypothetical protein [Methanococcus maripaludis]|uniref:Uncharacterized protein n=1 Tax=Methanococcus maripaludis TaxID=39152 RepID=A0A7J9S7E0_METMI|nr:hypothetical protein [Methanococcus maripaludis]MBB6495988.1 hypothetical protein [Methanococcus maripaludis]